MRGDVPAADRQGSRVGSKVEPTLARRLTAAFRCPQDGRGDHGPQYCWELGERPDREIVGGSLGVAASVLPGVECADLCSQKHISIAPIVAKLGRPPEPAEIARRLAPSGPANDRLRDVVRRAYEEAVRTRYRRYADYLERELSDADYVEIGPVSGRGATRRYGSGHIYEGLNEALTEMADSYAALEWTRFEREWGRAAVPTRAGTSHAGSTRPDLPAPTVERDETGGASAPTERVDSQAVPPPSTRQVDKASSTPPSAPIARVDDVPCRRSCNLRYRACLARCRDQPITGGEYDACAYECSGGSLACRGACGAAAVP